MFKVIKVFGIPDSVNHEAIAEMLDPLKFAIASSKEGVSEESVFVFFPHDIVQDGLGEELYVEITGLDDLLWDDTERQAAANKVAEALEVFCQAYIQQCSIIFIVPTSADFAFNPVIKYVSKLGGSGHEG